MFVVLITANFKFRNRSTCSKGPIKRTGKVCGDSQDLKSPGKILMHMNVRWFVLEIDSREDSRKFFLRSVQCADL